MCVAHDAVPRFTTPAPVALRGSFASNELVTERVGMNQQLDASSYWMREQGQHGLGSSFEQRRVQQSEETLEQRRTRGRGRGRDDRRQPGLDALQCQPLLVARYSRRAQRHDHELDHEVGL